MNRTVLFQIIKSNKKKSGCDILWGMWITRQLWILWEPCKGLSIDSIRISKSVLVKKLLLNIQFILRFWRLKTEGRTCNILHSLLTFVLCFFQMADGYILIIYCRRSSRILTCYFHIFTKPFMIKPSLPSVTEHRPNSVDGILFILFITYPFLYFLCGF